METVAGMTTHLTAETAETRRKKIQNHDSKFNLCDLCVLRGETSFFFIALTQYGSIPP